MAQWQVTTCNAVTMETWVWSLGREDPMEKEMVTYSSILAWEIPWTEESGGLQSVVLQRDKHSWAIKQQQAAIDNNCYFFLNIYCVLPPLNALCTFCPSVQFSSIAQSCPTLCNPKDCSIPGFPVLHHLPELVQIHVHWISDAFRILKKGCKWTYLQNRNRAPDVESKLVLTSR